MYKEDPRVLEPHLDKAKKGVMTKQSGYKYVAPVKPKPKKDKNGKLVHPLVSGKVKPYKSKPGNQ